MLLSPFAWNRAEPPWSRQAKFLRYLDLSENTIDKRAADYLVQAITISSGTTNDSSTSLSLPSNTSALSSFPEPAAALSEAPVAEDGSEAATEEEEEPMWKEDDFYENGDDDPEPLFTDAPLLREDPSSEAGNVLSIRLENCGLKGTALDALGELVRPGVSPPWLTFFAQLTASAPLTSSTSRSAGTESRRWAQ